MAEDSPYLSRDIHPLIRKGCCYCSVAESCLTFVTPWTGSHQDPLSWESTDKNTGVCCHFLLQGISLTQGLNTHLL